ncbi:tRNA wybutosine-synthesizing protein 4 isoform X2 [Notechis scutatus]|uniref:tRNA wybutosine-synthesizing protein 4 n=1 Tax=Notechis scutatus TaxID=8663 RepID=A0A6J1VMG2_9SAUR|nr:tRNA wybutosine-synthesizing protein 4 isoform X2 [Notechis scutatus]
MGGRRRRERREVARPLPPRPSPRVSGTGDSSAASKKSAAALGYTSDRFVMQLLPRGSPRRAPAIHRGYYVRARAVERSVRAFLLGTQGEPRRQVVSLGAGWDSLYFCLKDAGLLAGNGEPFFEVDLPEVASRKAARISGSAELRALAGRGGGPEDLGSVKYSGDGYQLLGVDLSDLALLEGALRGAGLDPTTPTLILAEVVLPYMEVERSDALIQWAAGHFLRACFILYEQIHPSDPFGRIMQSHFSRLQSPLRSLISYPDCKAQQMRFLQRGWTECHIVDMNEFYRSFVPGEEQNRIQALEPFDEFEEWHLKCSHYFILAASKGEASFAPPVFSRMEASPAHCAPCFAGTVATSFCVAGGAVAGLKRYGHSSVLLTPDIILTTGGFGDHGGRHCRLTELHILVKHQGGWRSGKVRLAELGMAWDGRLFHTVNVLHSGWAVVLGGRKSPESPALPPLCLKGLADADPLSPGNPVIELAPLLPVEGLAGFSVPRWRHTATVVTQEGQAYLFVYGGCSSGQSVLTDWHFLHLEGLHCQQVQIPVEGPVPLGRHSHSACSWAGGVLIAGGLTASEELLGSLLFLKPAGRGFRWHSLETCPPLTPRYSHTAHVHRGKLLLVGGVWLSPPLVPGVAVIDLETRALAEYRIDTTFLEWPLMLHNHSSVILPDTEEIILTGGGGNCFSFGTHLNWSPVCLDLSSIWRAGL